MHRRHLLAAAFASGALALGAAAAQTPAARKKILIGGKPAPVIDVHAHCEFPAAAALAAGQPFARKVPDSVVIGPERIAQMDARGIDLAVLSVNQYWWYQADRDLAAKVVEAQDEALAQWVRAHPGRFVALSSPALQFPELAAAQLENAVTRYGARGASIGGLVAGVVPNDVKFDPFWAKAEALGVPIFIHPNNAEAIVKPGALGDLSNIIGNPLETTLFLSRLLVDGVFDRFPNLTIIAAHGGGYLPSYFGRLETSCGRGAVCRNKRAARDILRSNIVADTMVFSDEGLRHLVAEMGIGQIVFGADMPYVWDDALDTIARAKWLSDAQKSSILSGNARRLLKLT